MSTINGYGINIAGLMLSRSKTTVLEKLGLQKPAEGQPVDYVSVTTISGAGNAATGPAKNVPDLSKSLTTEQKAVNEKAVDKDGKNFEKLKKALVKAIGTDAVFNKEEGGEVVALGTKLFETVKVGDRDVIEDAGTTVELYDAALEGVDDYIRNSLQALSPKYSGTLKYESKGAIGKIIDKYMVGEKSTVSKMAAALDKLIQKYDDAITKSNGDHAKIKAAEEKYAKGLAKLAEKEAKAEAKFYASLDKAAAKVTKVADSFLNYRYSAIAANEAYQNRIDKIDATEPEPSPTVSAFLKKHEAAFKLDGDVVAAWTKAAPPSADTRKIVDDFLADWTKASAEDKTAIANIIQGATEPILNNYASVAELIAGLEEAVAVLDAEDPIDP